MDSIFYIFGVIFLASIATLLIFGFISAFISAFICVRWLIRYVGHHNFVPFAWYRIAFGLVVLITAYTGLIAWSQ